MPEQLERIHYIVSKRISAPFLKNKSREPLDGFIHFDIIVKFFVPQRTLKNFPCLLILWAFW